jgi:hypothetical protein
MVWHAISDKDTGFQGTSDGDEEYRTVKAAGVTAE